MNIRLGDHCARHLSRLADNDDRIWVLDGDLADSDGAAHFAERHPHRFVMAGIAEQAMVSAAAGMAACGLRPWVFSFAAFLCYRAYDQIRIGLSQSRQPVTLVGSHSGGCLGRNGKTHTAMNDIAVMTSLPNIRVWAPADVNDLRLCVRTIMSESSPAYLRLPRQIVPELPGTPAPWRWLGNPAPIVLVGTGLGTHLATAAADHLTAQGVDVGVIHIPQVSPLPDEGLRETLIQAERVFVVEDHYQYGGLASLLRHRMPNLPLRSMGWPLEWSGQSGDDHDLLSIHGLNPDQLASTIASALHDANVVTMF